MATKSATKKSASSASSASAKSASRKPASSATEFAENGQTATPANDISKIITAVNAWAKPECADDDEAEQRIGEYFNLCVSKGEMPMFETMCLYLGFSDEKGKQYASGEGCSGRMTKLMQNALTVLKATEGKAVYAGQIRDVPYIWRSKQYFGYREPNSKIEDLLLGNVLKELPSEASIAKRYLEDIDEGDDNDSNL